MRGPSFRRPTQPGKTDHAGAQLEVCPDCGGALIFERQPGTGAVAERCDDCPYQARIVPRAAVPIAPARGASAMRAPRGSITARILAFLPDTPDDAQSLQAICAATNCTPGSISGCLSALIRSGRVDRHKVKSSRPHAHKGHLTMYFRVAGVA